MIEVTKYGANWCGPCRMLAPILETLKAKYPTVTFTDIDVDMDQETAREAGIRNIPMVIIRKDGEVVDRVTGVNTAQFFEAKINSLL